MTDPGDAARAARERALSRLLQGYSAEVTRPDRKTLDAAATSMPRGSRVYIASLPRASADEQVETARLLADCGFEPVPHVVARNLASAAALEDAMARFTADCGVRRILLLGGDRERPLGPFADAQALLDTGVIQRAGLEGVSLGCYPEGHPRIDDAVLYRSLEAKIASLEDAGIDVLLVSQFAFDAGAIHRYLRGLRARGIRAPLRIGVAGPARATTLLKYAVACGVGASLRSLRDRQNMTRDLLRQQTPEDVLADIALAHEAEPDLRIWGVHFFTFAALQKAIDWAEAHSLIPGSERPGNPEHLLRG